MKQLHLERPIKYMMQILKEVTTKNVFFCCIMKIIFDFIYACYVTQIYDYIGSIADINWSKNIFSWIVLFVLLYIYQKMHECDLKLCMCLLMTISIIPTLSVFWIGNESTLAFFEITVYWIIFEIAVLFFSKRTTRKKCQKEINDTLNNNAVITVIWIFTLICTVYFSYRYGSFRLWVSFEDVYAYRLNSSNYMSTIEGYVFGWTANLFIPLCLAVHMVNRKWGFAIIDICLAFMSYSIYGNKSMFFQIILVFGLLILKRYSLIESAGNMIMLFCGIASLLSALIYSLYAARMPIALCHRMFFIPAEAHFYYFDYFQTHPILLLRQSILRHFFDNPLSDTASILIGSDIKYNLSGAYNNLNNGLFSDAYQNFGFIGVLIYPIVIVWLLHKLCSAICNYHSVIKYSLIVGAIIYIVSAYIFSWLFSGGLLIAFLVVYLIKQRKVKLNI